MKLQKLQEESASLENIKQKLFVVKQVNDKKEEIVVEKEKKTKHQIKTSRTS